MFETLPLALPESSNGAAAQLILPKRRRGGHLLAAVVICPDLVGGDGVHGRLPGHNAPGDQPESRPADRDATTRATAEWIARGLARGGAAVTLPAPPSASGAGRVDECLGSVIATVAQLRRTSTIDAQRIAVLGIGTGAAIACAVGAGGHVARIAFVGPVAPELIVRRLDRAADRGGDRAAERGRESSDAAIMRRLAAAQPLRTLATAPPRPTLIVHSASDEQDGPEHAQAIAMALELDGRTVERIAVAFVDPEFEAIDDEVMRAAVLAPLKTFLLATNGERDASD